MKKKIRQLFASLLVAVMILTAVPLSGLSGLELDLSWFDFSTKASAASYSGTLSGTLVTWSLDTSTGVLTIGGSGEMPDWTSYSYQPWHEYSSYVKTVVIGNSITRIGSCAFSNKTSLTKVTIPSSVTSIGEGAFASCTSFKSISIPDSVKEIEYQAFLNTGYYKNSSNWESGVLYIGKHLVDVNEDTIGSKVTIKNGTLTVASGAFEVCSAVTSITIPDSVTGIGYGAFYGTGYYSNSANWENGVLYIGKHLVATDRQSIDSIYSIKKGTLTVASDCFSYCDLTNVVIPESVKNIGRYAFNNPNSIAEYLVSGNNNYYSSDSYGVLFNKNKTELIRYPVGCSRTHYTIPSTVKTISEAAFGYCTSLTSVTIPSSVTTIMTDAFSDCDNLKSVTIPNSVLTIGKNTFSGCDNLKSVTIGNSVRAIGDFAFSHNFALESITIPQSVTNLGECVFSNCYALTTAEINAPLKNISPNTFAYCRSLTSVTIPVSVKSIDFWAFAGCKSLKDVYYGGSQAQWNAITIDYKEDGNERLKTATIHYTMPSHTVTYNYANNGGTSATKTSAAVKEGSAIDLTPTATKSGWTFVGWNTDKNATTGLTSLKMGTSDVTLYAIYKKTLTATFVDYSGTEKKTRTATATIYNNATSGTVSAPTQNAYTGWTKRGWTTSTSASASAVSSYSISADTIFYGLYSRTLTLSYNKNGGNTTPSSQTGTQSVNSYSITAYKNPSFTLAGAISKADSAFTGWAANSTSGTKYNAGANIIISADTTMYATWQAVVNVYNLGEETYNFKNFGDNHSPNGHCFGMSMTSSAYYLGELDVRNIGISKSSQLYTVSNTSAVQQPICYLQNIQGYYSNQSIVAGGTYYLNYPKKIYNINSDWQAVVNYVKNHKYDNTGKLQIGFRNDGDGGHAINFLRYEVVNGQERIYAYDNNFPTIETYFYMSNGNVYQAGGSTFGNGATIDCIALRDVSKFMKLAENYDASRYIYGDSDMITIEGAIAYPMECGDDSYTMFEIPAGTDQIIINPLVDNATFDYMGTDYSFGKVDDDTYGVFVLSGNDASTGGSSAQLTVMKKHGKVKSVSIDNFALNYKASTTISPAISVDSGVKYTVSYSSSNDSVATVDANGKVTAKGTGSATITVTVTDEYGNTVTDTCEVKVSYQWWEWIIIIVLFGWIWY